MRTPFRPASGWSICLSLGLVSAIMLYFIWLAPPMADNFIFSRDIRPGFAMFYGGSQIAMEPLTLASAWRQSCELYFTWCGRFTGNLAVFLLFLLPHWLYSLLAACLYGLYLLALTICIFGRSWKDQISPAWIFGLAALLWCSIPSYGEAFFWLSVGGQIALLGQALIFLPFRLALDRPFRISSPLAKLLFASGLCIAGAAVSMLDFATSAALPPTAIACVAFLWLRDRSFPWLATACALGLCLGAVATFAAPGNACRVALSTDPDLAAYLTASWPARIANWILHLPGAALMQATPLLLLILACIRLARTAPDPWPRRVPVAAWLFFLPACLTHAAYLFTAWPPARALATSSVQILICGCIVFAAAPASRPGRLFRVFRALFYLYCALSIPFEAFQFWTLHREYAVREELLAQAAETAELPPFSVRPTRHQPLGGNLADIFSDPDAWINRAVARYHGLKSVRLAMPETLDGRFIYQEKPDSAARLEFVTSNSQLRLAAASQDTEIHVYYHGKQGLLSRLPFGLDRKIYERLVRARKGDWLLRLVPLFMARADIAPDAAKSEHLKLQSARMIWLVEPGKPWWWPTVIPLANALQPPDAN